MLDLDHENEIGYSIDMEGALHDIQMKGVYEAPAANPELPPIPLHLPKFPLSCCFDVAKAGI